MVLFTGLRRFFAVAFAFAALSVIASAPAASAFSTCAPGYSCDAPGQACSYFPLSSSSCYYTLSCTGYQTTQTTNVLETTGCFCMQSIDVTAISSNALSNNGASVTFSVVLRQGANSRYVSKTQTLTDYLFGSGSDLTCIPTSTPTPVPYVEPTTCGIPNSRVDSRCFDVIARKGCTGNWCIATGISADYCYIDRSNDRIVVWEDKKTCLDPAVKCKLYLSGPGFSGQYIETESFDAMPNDVYTKTVSIPQSYFTQSGSYSLDVKCSMAVPDDTEECTSGCAKGSASVSFQSQSCGVAVSVQADKSSYTSGESLYISGTVRNSNQPISTNVNVRIYGPNGASVTVPVTASNGQFSTNYLLPQSFVGGNYYITAEAMYNSCPVASSSVGFSFTPCDVAVSSAVTQTGSAAPVTVFGSVSNKGAPAPSANVTIKLFNAGSMVGQYFSGTLTDGSYSLQVPALSAGTYTAQVEARYLSCPVATQQTSVTSSCDLHADVSLSRQNFSSGQSVVVSGTMTDSRGAPVSGNYKVELRDSTGLLVASATGVASIGRIDSSFNNVGTGDYEATVYSTYGSCTSTDKASFKVVRDFEVSLFKSPDCGSTQTGYQLKVKNNLGTSTTLGVAYSSISRIQLSGPTSISVDAYSEKVFNVDAIVSDGFTGGSLGVVTFTNSNSAANFNLELPICATGTIKLTAIDRTKIGYAGDRVCYKLMVENKGPDSGTVTLYYASNYYSSSVSGEFDVSQFRLSSYETRNDISFCATVPNAQFTSLPITLSATSAFGQSSDSVSIGTSYSNMAIGFTGCPYVAPGSQYPVQIRNGGDTADYTVEVSDNGYLHPSVSPYTLYRFTSGSTQSVAISFAPTGRLAANYVNLIIRRDGSVVSSQQLCFNTLATAATPTPNYESSLTPINRSALNQINSGSGNKLAIVVYAPQITYAYDGSNFTADASFLVQNNEFSDVNLRADSALLPSSWQVSFSPSVQTIRPGETKEFVMHISAASFERTNYSGVISLQEQSGRSAQAQFTIDASAVNAGTGILTGFASLASGPAFLGVLLLAIGAVLLYGIRKNRRAAASGAE